MTLRLNLLVHPTDGMSFDDKLFKPLTIEKLHYNRNHFYNTALIQQQFKNEIVNPILEYAAS